MVDHRMNVSITNNAQFPLAECLSLKQLLNQITVV